MKTSTLLCFALQVLVLFSLYAQVPCDTGAIRNTLNRSAELLDSGDAQKALELALEGMEALKHCPSNADLAQSAYLQTDHCYRTLSTDFLQRGLFNRAIDMAERDIDLHQNWPNPVPDPHATAYLLLGSAQNLNGNLKLSVETNLKGLLLRKSANPKDPRISSHYDQIINKLVVLKDTATARYYLQQWEAFHQSIGEKASASARLRLAINWSTFYENTGNLKPAAKIIEDTLSFYSAQLRARNNNMTVGIAEFNLCELYAQLRDFHKSLEYAERNVSAIETRIKQQNGKLFSRSHYAWYLAQSARACWQIYLETQDPTWLQKAEQRAQAAEAVLYAIRDRAPEDGHRDWIANSVGIVANLSEVRYGLYRISGHKKHIERNFESVEASKMFVVQQFLHETYALQWGGLPDSLYQQEANFRQSINDLETSYFMLRAKPNTDTLIAINDKNLFEIRDRYRTFLKGLEKSYPEYFRLKYQHPAASIRELQNKLLQPGQCLLDLAIENELIFALVVRPDTVVWVATPFDSITAASIRILQEESSLFAEYQNLPEAAYLEKLQQYTDASFQVYQSMIAPVRHLLTEEVLLVPRDYAANLPYGALLTRKETNMGKPHLWHFLEQELVLSETYSTEFFRFVQNRPNHRNPDQSVLALAPFFEGSISNELQIPVGDIQELTRRDIFAPLPGSGAEAKAIAQISKGKSMIGPEATKSNFIKSCSNFKVLHLATHSVANDILGEYSFVALQTDHAPQKIDLLYARDIYGLSLSADLVVLSACESALGQYREDEGIIGLSRAFSCAGARNIIASLWTVNDASTKDLMILFYKELDKGTSFNRALALAKRKFIQSNRQFAHPYYWAGFVLNGR